MMTNRLNRPLFLCGMMGSGKTTVGKILAAKLELPFTDLDEEIEKHEKMSIPEIFRRKGEKAFRKTEKKLILQYSGAPAAVIALGGGALQDQQMVDFLKLNGWLVFLNAPLSVLLERLRSDSGRPLLQSTDGNKIRNKITTLLEKREFYYLQAHINFETRQQPPEAIADAIVRKTRSLMHES